MSSKVHLPQAQLAIKLCFNIPDTFEQVSILVVSKTTPHSTESSEIQIPSV